MLNDLQAAVHSVRRRPGFSVIAALTLAIGVTASVTVFALVRAVLLEPEPYRAPRELFRFVPTNHMAESPFQVQDLEEIGQLPGIARVAGCYDSGLPTLRTHPALVAAPAEVSEGFFAVFDVVPHLGRTLQPPDFLPGVRTAVISFDLWDARFGRAPDVVGRGIQLNRQAFTIVGVMPSTFAPPCGDENARRQAWIAFDPTDSSRPPRAGLSVTARLRANEPLAVVQARLDEYGVRRAGETGNTSYAGMLLTTLGAEKARAARPGLLLLQATAACLLLIACVNLGSMFLLDASRRDVEFLTRAFIGASPSRLVRQLLLESTVVAMIGSAVGVGASFLTGSAVRSLVEPVLPRGVTYQVELPDAAAGLSAGIVVSLVFAAFSAVVAARRAREAGGRTQVQGTAVPSIRRFHDALIAIQVGFSVVLTIATTVISLSYVEVAATELAIDAHSVATSILYLPSDAPSQRRAPTAQQTIADRLRQSDGTLDIAFSDTPPFAGGAHARVALDDVKGDAAPRSISANIRKVTPNYFYVLSIPVRRGRPLAIRSESQIGEAVASASFARLLGADDALGHVVRARGTDRAYRIVGIAADVPTVWMWQPATPTLYIGLDRTGTTELSVLVRTSNVAATTHLLQEVIAATVPEAPEVTAEGLAAILWKSEAQRAFYVASMVAFALVAVLIAGVGIHTAVRCRVALSLKEYAIRMSLGAAPHTLRAQVLRNALVSVTVGIAAGLLSALWLARLAWSYEHASVIVGVIIRTAPSVIPTALVAAAAALLLSAIACWLPARRAASVDPAVLLKGD